MELITAIVGAVIGWLVALAAHVVARDAYASVPRYARRLIEWAVRRLPSDQQDRYLEEWLADLNDRPSILSKFQHAVECCICAKKISSIWREKPKSLVHSSSFDRTWNMDLDAATGALLMVTVALVKQKRPVEPVILDAAIRTVDSVIGPVNVKALANFVAIMENIIDDPAAKGGTFNLKMGDDESEQFAEVLKRLELDIDVAAISELPKR
jgi:hypothetical protein